MHDAGNLRAIKPTARVEIDDHRGRRLLLLAEKPILIGQGQVHAGILHRRQALDGAGQLTLQGPLVIHPLLELGDAKFAVVHHLKAGNRALGQALGGQLQAGIVDLVGWHQNGPAALGVAVRHVHLGQLGDDGPGIFVRQTGEQHLVIGLAGKQHRRHHGHYRQGGQAAPAQALSTVHLVQTLLQGSNTCTRGAGNSGGSLSSRNFSKGGHILFSNELQGSARNPRCSRLFKYPCPAVRR